ncbi:tRNA (guanosine(46)-N7)-methyltransferase TrmB [Candidatus Hoaglandella endobia]|uniref:tRNA (guanine-N(7)-)-methyltransferase n=1 Tax=Candidatus Hoaglandella endobia TaxID=1778263 RepID=A0A143WTR5_9ENTR|nr:tRNA (guanosine(46)-N7)-methyltransferase TrmB [Candidatus Hoaglandella endobia]CUX97140.1 tRNA (guanine-N(7)-)-methyltransferase [Candidatus Hoaglandella endobia]
MKNNFFISPEDNDQDCSRQHIRSFVLRQRRLKQGQQHALDTLWTTMGVDYKAQPLSLDALFGRATPVTLEIGFGMGESLVTMATAYPERSFLGIEVHWPGVGACLASAHKAEANNLRVMCHDAVEVLEYMIPDQALAMVQLFFPDPWPKVRHHKRRIMQLPFVALIGRKLADHGILHIATDWQSYAKHILMVMSVNKMFLNLSTSGDYVPRPVNRPYTKFEQRGQRLGYSVWDLIFTKKSKVISKKTYG